MILFQPSTLIYGATGEDKGENGNNNYDYY